MSKILIVTKEEDGQTKVYLTERKGPKGLKVSLSELSFVPFEALPVLKKKDIEELQEELASDGVVAKNLDFSLEGTTLEFRGEEAVLFENQKPLKTLRGIIKIIENPSEEIIAREAKEFSTLTPKKENKNRLGSSSPPFLSIK